jgi:RNA polymerase sigma-70 factor, ECF subfamily
MNWNCYMVRIAAGDPAALGALHAESASLIFAVALRIVRDRLDAEEVVADTYTQVWRTAGHFCEAKGNARNWLVSIVRSRAIDRLRHRNTRSRAELAVQPSRPPESRDVQPTPEQVLLTKSEVHRLRRLVDALPLVTRTTLKLAFYAGLTHAEIAARRGEPLGTVKTRIRQGLRKLRSEIEGPAVLAGCD